MKKINYVLLLLAIVAVSCSKDGMLTNERLIDQQLIKTCAKQVNVFKVSPNGTDDTQSILDAFALARAAGPGSTVQLSAGIFRIGMIEIADFSGSFNGAGKCKTIITNLPNLPQADVFNGGQKYPSLIKFSGGNLSMSDMTIKLAYGPCVDPAVDPIGDLYCILYLTSTDYNAENTDYSNTFIKASIDNVDFIAGYDWGTGFAPLVPSMYNVWSAIMFGIDSQWGSKPGLTLGDFSVTHCRFENEMLAGVWLWGAEKDTKAFFANNSFSGCPMQILLASCMGSEIRIMNNIFDNGEYCDLFIDNYNWLNLGSGFLTQSAHFTVTGNTFRSPAGVTSLYMNDARRPLFPDEGFPQKLDVTDNNFTTGDGGIAIQSLNNIGARIGYNRFSGTGKYGIMADGTDIPATYGERISILGNNFTMAQYSDAGIYLGPYTKDCKVVGISADNVIDNGVNNSVIGLMPHKGCFFHGNISTEKFRFLPKKLFHR